MAPAQMYPPPLSPAMAIQNIVWAPCSRGQPVVHIANNHPTVHSPVRQESFVHGGCAGYGSPSMGVDNAGSGVFFGNSLRSVHQDLHLIVPAMGGWDTQS